jgi:hypothetical protein
MVGNAHAAFHEFMKKKQSLVHIYKEAVRSALASDAANDCVYAEQGPGALIVSRKYATSHLKTAPNGMQYVGGRPEYTMHSCSHPTLTRSDLDDCLSKGSLDAFLTKYVTHEPMVTSPETGVAQARAGIVSSFFSVMVDGQPRSVRFTSTGKGGHHSREVMFQKDKHVLTYASGASSCENATFLRMAPSSASNQTGVVWEALVVFGTWSKCFCKIVRPPPTRGEDDALTDTSTNRLLPTTVARSHATKDYLSSKFPVVRYFPSDGAPRNDQSIPYVKGLLHTMVRLRWAYAAITSIGAAMLHEKRMRR